MNQKAEQEKYKWWLGALCRISDRKKIMLRELLGSERAIYNIEENRLKKIGPLTEGDRDKILSAARITEKEIEEYFYAQREKKIYIVTYFDESYPLGLKLLLPPYALYVKGKLPEKDRLSVAVVGARQCSGYGERTTLRFAQALAGCGVQVISGMALGIDGAAHRGALNGGGDTYAVLGCGTDVCYPKDHAGLYRDILGSGGILSEQPPGALPLREHFPARNRIISGLADLVLVMEARKKSGSLITADFALEQGRDVYALPGPVSSDLSCGCNRLIRQGAGILLSPEDFLEELRTAGKLRECGAPSEEKNKTMLESTEKLVYSKLDLYPKAIGALQEETGCSPRELLECLVSLELKGYIRETGKNYYVRNE